MKVGVRLEVGKVPNNILKESILDKIRFNRKEVLIRPKIGEDCTAVDFGENACVLTSDPITGSVNDVGRLAVHVSCNDIASCGAEPLGLLVTLLAPPETTERELEMVMEQLAETANFLNVDIIGGHTEITRAVNRLVIVSTAVGKILKDKVVSTSGAKAGEDVVMTKFAGIEGTAIIASDKEDELLKIFDKDFLEKAKSYVKNISVVKEGVIAGEFGVSSMHDVTEGGILGAVWEIAEASGTGVEIEKNKIPIAFETLKIAEYYDIDPLKLISSGCMVITCDNGYGLVKKLKASGIEASVIGKMTDRADRLLYDGERTEKILQPDADELYKVIK